jgi:hypothetical protein
MQVTMSDGDIYSIFFDASLIRTSLVQRIENFILRILTKKGKQNGK